RTLPVPDKTVDLLVGAGVLGEASAPQALLAEIARVLVPSGRAILVEPSAPAEAAAEGPARASDEPAEARLRRLVAACPPRRHAPFTRHDDGGSQPFVEITLKAEPPPPPPSRRDRRAAEPRR